MGLLDPDLLRNKLKGLLGGMPLVQAAQGQAQVSQNGLLAALRSMPVFDAKSGAQDAFNSGLNMLGVGRAGAVENTNAEMVAAAKKHFGKTYSPAEAGYMTPAGEMLDMSGRHYGPKVKAGERDWYRGQRQVDHRELGDEIYSQIRGGREGSIGGTEAMRTFMNEANMLRLQPGAGFETTFVPTKDQLSAIERVWAYAKDPVMVDVAHPKTGWTIGSFEMRQPTAKKLENQIKKILADYDPAK